MLMEFPEGNLPPITNYDHGEKSLGIMTSGNVQVKLCFMKFLPRIFPAIIQIFLSY